MATPLRLPYDIPRIGLWDRRARSSRPASLAVAIGSLVVLLLVSGAFWAGRIYESRTQLGYLLAAAPTLEDLRAATRSADSLSMRFLLQMGRLRRHR